MSEIAERLYFRLADGAPLVGEIELDGFPDSPEEGIDWLGQLILDTRDAPHWLGAALDRWSGWNRSLYIDAAPLVRYVRLFHADTVRLVCAVYRNSYSGTRTVDYDPRSGQVRADGLLIITHDDAQAWFAPGDVTDEQLHEAIQVRMRTWNYYTTGEVYCWVTRGFSSVGLGEPDVVIEGPVFGYYGLDDALSGLRESVPPGAVEIDETEYDALVGEAVRRRAEVDVSDLSDTIGNARNQMNARYAGLAWPS